jgi:hypothetical protein
MECTAWHENGEHNVALSFDASCDSFRFHKMTDCAHDQPSQAFSLQDMRGATALNNARKLAYHTHSYGVELLALCWLAHPHHLSLFHHCSVQLHLHKNTTTSQCPLAHVRFGEVTEMVSVSGRGAQADEPVAY